MTLASEQKKINNDANDLNLDNNDIDDQLEDEAVEAATPAEESSEFALKMINSVKAMNNGELSHYEVVNTFSLADELKCLFMFIKALPHLSLIHI